MPVAPALRINMTGLCEDPAAESARYRAALDMAAYAEEHGFAVVSVEEHHCAENGWLPSPLTMAGMIIGRTQRIAVNVTALLVTLYDPIRLAEDIAVLDLASGGRFSFVAGLGYRPEEFHALNKDWAARGRLMDEVIETMLLAWKGEPFVYHGKTIRVTPSPLSRPHPPFALGGMSKAAARRAARFGLPFFPPMEMRELGAFYEAELERNNQQGAVFYPAESNAMLIIDEEPEKAWPELAPYFLRETQEYSSWQRDGIPRPGEQAVASIDELKAQKRYEILTPDECIERVRSEGEGYSPCLHPLVGGMPLDRAWSSLRLYAEKVLAPLAGQGQS
jgi:alkanesulfonate monooxygenase SsuD/methylene tetrahydromethanopterin reductase-like flavin-dependent oxidoreductase (luciferase family)